LLNACSKVCRGVFHHEGIRVRDLSGGPLEGLSQPIFLTIEVAEIIPYRQSKPYENVSFLTHLYVKKQWSLRRISKELGCCKATVRKKLLAAGVNLIESEPNGSQPLIKKIFSLKERGMSYQAIANTLNLWRIPTRSGIGRWHAKTVQDLI